MKLPDRIYVTNRTVRVEDEIGDKIGSFNSYSVFELIGEQLYEKPLGDRTEQLVDYLKKFSEKVVILNKIPFGVEREIRDETGEERLFPLSKNLCEFLKEEEISIEC